MYSRDLRKYCFGDWQRFSVKDQKRVLHSLPKKEGIYAIRYRKLFCRFKGKSDIMYLGSSMNKTSGLQGRIRFFFKPYKEQKTSLRINKILKSIDGLEIAFSANPKGKNFRCLEKKLLQRYEKTHGELPPWNRSV